MRRIFIPTKGRHHRRLRIIDMLRHESLTLVVEPQDYAYYERIYGDEVAYLTLEKNDAGVAHARNTIIRESRRAKAPVWMIDDDVTSFVRSTEDGFEPITIGEVMQEIEEDSDPSCIAAGPCFAQSIREYPSKAFTWNRQVGNVYYVRAYLSDIWYREELKIRSDVTFILEHLLAGIGTQKFNRLGFRVPTCGASGKGGCTQWYESGEYVDYINKVAEMFPDYVSVEVKETGAQVVRTAFNWKAIDHAFAQNRVLRNPS